jgi:8-oxo-dGTP pyrophosphatase MutT (NUDIX family)
VLLLRGWDPLRPRDRYWFTIGGAAHRGEPLRSAAAREMREEIGLRVEEAQLGEALVTSTIKWSQLGIRIVQDQAYFAVAVPAGLTVSLSGMDWLERFTIQQHAWLTPEDLVAHPVRSADPRLPEVMRLAVAAVLE